MFDLSRGLLFLLGIARRLVMPSKAKEGNNIWDFCCWKATNVGNLVAGRQQKPIPTDSNGFERIPTDSNGFERIRTDSNGFLRKGGLYGGTTGGDR